MLATALPPVLQAPVAAPSPNPAAGGGSGNGPESFARMLGAADARRQAQNAASKAGEGKPAAAQAPDGREAASPATERSGAPSEETEAADDTAPAGTGATAEAALPADPALGSDAAALLAGLAALPRPAQAEAASRAATAAGHGRGGPRAAAGADTVVADARPHFTAEGDVSASGTGATPRPGGTAGARGAADGKGEAFTQLMHAARSADRATEPAAGTGTQGLQAAAAATAEPRAPAVDAAAGTAVPMATAAAAGVMPGGPGMSAATPAHARLGASPGSPEFATQLGAQLSTFVREGVQHARLELHPLELGPVTVQIALDGTLARVNMAAEHASTRQALEQAMPALAGSLREAGLTLSGGGVFEQPRQPQPEGGGTAGSGAQGGRQGERGTPQAGADRGPAPVNTAALRRRGVVDLVA